MVVRKYRKVRGSSSPLTLKAGGLSQNGNSRPPPAHTTCANMKATAHCNEGLVLVLVLVLVRVPVLVLVLARVLGLGLVVALVPVLALAPVPALVRVLVLEHQFER